MKFCSKCGEQLSDDSRFCTQCGASCDYVQHNKKVYSDDDLLQIISDYSSGYLKIPNLPRSLLSSDWSAWRFDFLNNLNPVAELQNFKEELIRCLVDATHRTVELERIQKVVDLAYSVCRNMALSNQKEYFMRVMEKFLARHEFDDEEFTYSTLWSVDSDITEMFICARCVALISCELKDSSGLRAAKVFLRVLESTYCKADSDTGNISRSGYLLTLPQFRPVRDNYNNLIEFIQNSIIAIDPDAKEEIEKEKTELQEQQTKADNAENSSVMTRVLLSIAMPLLMYLVYNILSAKRAAEILEIGELAFWISGGTLTLLTILVNVRFRKPIVVIILNVLILALFYPIAQLVSGLIELVKGVAFIVVAGAVLFLTSFLHSDRMSPN